MDAVYLTRAGYQKIYDQVVALKKERLKIADAIEEARLQGDLSENAEYDAAKEAQAHNAMRMSELEGQLTKVRIIEDEDIPSDKVYIGAIVSLVDVETKEKMKYMMVSPEESDYDENKISITSPIGKGLMGKAAGEVLDITVPAGILKYKIVKIERPK